MVIYLFTLFYPKTNFTPLLDLFLLYGWFMNWLAHFALSPPEFELQLGNLLADKISIEEWKNIPNVIAKGIELHHEIDWYCDRHPAFLKAKEYIDLKRAVLKPVVLDILFDFHLHSTWDSFHSEPFSKCWERFLCEYDKRGSFPEVVKSFVELLRNNDVLESYCNYGGIQHALYRVENRLMKNGRVINLQSSLPSIQRNESKLRDCFVMLYRDLQNYCRDWLKIDRF